MLSNIQKMWNLHQPPQQSRSRSFTRKACTTNCNARDQKKRPRRRSPGIHHHTDKRRSGRRPRSQLWSSSSATLWATLAMLIMSLQTQAQSQGPLQAPTEAPLVQSQIPDCITAMARSDANRDNFLSRDFEYVSFMNILSQINYGSSPFISFEALQPPITSLYDVWANPATGLDITGSSPGGTPLTPARQEHLQAICYDALTVLSELSAPIPSPSQSLAPTIPPPSLPVPVEKTFEECITGMYLSDLNRNEAIEKEEYVRFANFVSNDQYGFTTYEGLPDLMRFNYVVLSDVDATTGIRSFDITGATPTLSTDSVNIQDDLTAEQIQYLQNICQQTQTAVNTINLSFESESVAPSASPGLTIPKPTTQPPAPTMTRTPSLTIPTSSSAPSVILSQRPTISYGECRLSIAIADESRDNLLSEEEYVQLVYRLSDDSNEYRFVSYYDLPMNLKNNFVSLAAQGQTLGQIDVYGAVPGQVATPEEQEFLQEVCYDTRNAIAAAPTPVPVIIPTASPTADFSDCRKQIAFSDTSPRNNFMGQQEYVVFVNLLAKGSFLRSNYNTLPKVLRDNFVTLASVERENPEENGYGDAIYVYGTIPTSSPEAIQFEFLRRVCEDTALALDQALGQPTPAPIWPPIVAITPAPSITAPSPRPTTTSTTPAPFAPETPNPTVERQPTANTTPRPTLVLTRLPTQSPISSPSSPQPTPEATIDPKDDGDDGGGINVGAIVGGVVGGVVGLCLFCVGIYVFSATLLALLACCGIDVDDNNSKSKFDENKTDDGSDHDYNADNFPGFGQPGTPKPGKGAFENIATAASPSGHDDELDLEVGSKLGLASSDTGSKQFGQYGGPDLPMDFGVDLEDIDQFENNSTTSSGSREMRPSDVVDEDEDEGESDDASEHSEEAFEYTEDQENAEFDSGGFFGGQEAGWGQPNRKGHNDEEEEEGSYSAEDSYDEEESGDYQEDQTGEDEESVSYESDEDYGSDEEEDSDGEIEKTNSPDTPDTLTNKDFDTFDAFGEDDGGFETEAFGADIREEEEEEEVSHESESGTYDDDDEASQYSEDINKIDEDLESQIDNDDWDGVAESIRSFDHNPNDLQSPLQSSEEASEYTEDMTSVNDSPDPSPQSTEFRVQVEELVHKKIPDEIGNIDDMIEQFQGRESDLIQALLAMEGEDDSGSQEEGEEEGSYYSNGQSQYSGSQDDEGNPYVGEGKQVEEDSYYSDEQSEPGSYENEIPVGNEEGSFFSDEQSDRGSYYSGEDGSYADEGSYCSEEGSGGYED